MKKTYTVNVTCDNCEQHGVVALEKGTPVPGKMTCPNCGCETARKVIKLDVSLKKPWGYDYLPPHTLQTEPPNTIPFPGWSSVGDRPPPSILDEQ